jgi:hypothetical protein
MTNQRQFFQRPRLWGLLCGLTLAVTLLFTPAGAGTAQAATTTCDYTTSPPTCTTTFTYTGAAQSWTVPSGVTQATFVVDGAQVFLANRKVNDWRLKKSTLWVV